MSAQVDLPEIAAPKPKRKYTVNRARTVTTGKFRKGTREYDRREKARLLMILQFFDGNQKRTAQMTGVSTPTIRKAMKEAGINEASDFVICNDKLDLEKALQSLHRLINQLAVITMTQASECGDPVASAKSLSTCTDLLFRFENEAREQRREERQMRKETYPKPTYIGEFPSRVPSLDEITAETRKRENIEELVLHVMTDAAKDGAPITRKEALEMLRENNPDQTDLINELLS